MSTVTVTQTRSSLLSSSSSSSPPPSPSDPTRDSSGRLFTHVKIDDSWYNLTVWKSSHPGGETILEQMNGNDATDAFYSLHSPEAIARLSKLPKLSSPPDSMIKSGIPIPPPPTTVAINFRKFRQQLMKDGWFNRSIGWEIFYSGMIYLLCFIGSYLTYTDQYLWLAVICLAVAMQQAGWVGHDHVHGRDSHCKTNGLLLSALVNAFSRNWWSKKHNTHHVFTNYIGVDADIENDPVFHLFFPSDTATTTIMNADGTSSTISTPVSDPITRRMQHWYFVPVAAILYVSWRVQSLLDIFAFPKHHSILEWACFLVNYAWLYTLGWKISLLSIYFGGMLVASIVTATHQSEAMIESPIPTTQEGIEKEKKEKEELTKTGAVAAAVVPAPASPAVISTSGPASFLPTTPLSLPAEVVKAPTGLVYSFCEGQFMTTRDAKTSDFLSEYLWGGMQYQLEHHLFPTMPKYHYAALAPLVENFAKENGLTYGSEPQWELLKRNFNTLKFFAQKDRETAEEQFKPSNKNKTE